MADMLRENIPFLIPIAAISVTAFGIILERLIVFFLVRIRRRNRISAGLDYYSDCYLTEAEELLRKEKAPEARVLSWAIENDNLYGEDSFAWKLEAYAIRRINVLERGVGGLTMLANIATLLGLLGTVTGMILAFYGMKETGSSDPYVLAGGISQALVTTAAGLLTAIPCLLFHSFLAGIIRRHREGVEMMVSEVLAVRKERG